MAGSLKGSNGSVSSIIGSEGMDFGFFKHGSELKGFIEFFGSACLLGVHIESDIKRTKVGRIKSF